MGFLYQFNKGFLTIASILCMILLCIILSTNQPPLSFDRYGVMYLATLVIPVLRFVFLPIYERLYKTGKEGQATLVFFSGYVGLLSGLALYAKMT